MQRSYPILLLITLLLGTFLVFRPGLSGPFLFDDEPNLQGLSNSRGVEPSDDVFAFLATGRSGPTGRPLALLSFFIDDNAWPSEPGQFKRTNLLLHILSGTLIAWLSFRLALIARVSYQQACYIAVATSALWLVHPLNVSTVLYVVQRMTILAAIFVCAGLIAYTHGRSILNRRPKAGMAWILAGLLIGTSLATLSKETGVLLPVFALLIETFFFRSNEPQSPLNWRYWRFGLLYAPSIALFLYFPFNLVNISHSYTSRDFSLSERLLTQSRVLWEYVGQIGLPRAQGSGLFHDDYVISRGLFEPTTTLVALVLWAAILVLAVHLRRSYPLLTFSLAWFLVGHLIESTFIPLELYFEHRNYLPMFGFIFVGTYIVLVYPKTHLIQWASRSLLVTLIAIFATMSHTQAQIWGNPATLAAIWSAENPDSPRAQQLAANLWLARGEYGRAKQGLEAAYQAHPNNPGLLLQVLQVNCLQGTLFDTDIEQTKAALRQQSSHNQSTDISLIETLPRLYLLHSNCAPLSREHLDEMVFGILQSPHYGAALKASLYYLRGRQYAEEGKLDPAMQMLNSAYALNPSVDIALLQSYWLMTAGLYEDALEYVSKAQQLDDSDRWPFQSRRHADIDFLRKSIEQLR